MFSTFETCLYGMDKLFKNAQDETLFHKNVLKDTKEHQFKIDEINLVKVIDGHHCDVIAKDAKGFRSYRVTLEKNSKFPHLYRIFDVQGQKLVSNYQWRANL